ncbi:hypothetical protein [Thalassovita aquimarina]|uniref:Permease n=1 Tax=Thalassovita aquimarina TaxID=2785917 RepID=A0ABS5HQ30_9RHOB|nr:hypothetical protein [Thalassovita aquimarina]MBR9650703.1 hypothetical protein [Thalassovita aquimarina]
MKNITADPPPAPRRRKVIDNGFLVLLAFTVAGGIGVMVKSGIGRVGEIAVETLGFIAVLSPKIAAGVFIAATLPLILPRDRVAAWIGRNSGLRGLSIAMLAGMVIPGGPAMTFPLAAGFAAAGADLGAIIAFVSGWSLLSLNRTLIWEFSFLPHDMVALRWIVSLPLPVLLGFAVRLLPWRVRA